MLNDRSSILSLLETRRSGKPRELIGSGPSDQEMERILTIASRVPDHGKLTPWRFIVFEGDARLKAGETISQIFRADRPDATPEQMEIYRLKQSLAALTEERDQLKKKVQRLTIALAEARAGRSGPAE